MSLSKSKTLDDVIREYASGKVPDLSAFSQKAKLSARPVPIIFDDIIEVPEVVKYKSPKETWDRSTQAMGQFNAVPVEWNMWTGKWLRELVLRVENYINGIPNSFTFKHIKFL